MYLHPEQRPYAVDRTLSILCSTSERAGVNRLAGSSITHAALPGGAPGCLQPQSRRLGALTLDRGVPYASSAYVERLQERGIQISRAARGNPYENAQAESFFKTLKSAEVYLTEYRDIDEAQQHLDRFIEDVYNTKRLHSALGYRPPAEFELLLSKQLCESALAR
jgi:transposase InsO family protein